MTTKAANNTQTNGKKPTYEELQQKLEALQKAKDPDLSFKIGEKGGLSVYGLGRFPVTLYYEQWKKLLAAAEQIDEFLEDNKQKFKLRDSTAA